MSDVVLRDGIVSIPTVGGFPVDNLAYWKSARKETGDGLETVLHVQFRTGGFIDIPTTILTEEGFVSLVYGAPF